jgi:hypothetical protein
MIPDIDRTPVSIILLASILILLGSYLVKRDICLALNFFAELRKRLESVLYG